MSSILKALRKLEEERAIRQEASIDIARDILRQPISRRRRSTRGRPLFIVLGIVLLGGVGWGLVERQRPALSSSPAFSPAATVPAPSPGPPPESPAADSSPVPASGLLAAVQADKEILEEVISEPALAVPARKADAQAKKAPPAAPPKAPVPAAPAASTAPAPVRPVPALLPAAPPEAAEFTVSGVAYQDDPEARLAVVNDLPVMQGTTIDGATIVEILPDAVRFSRDGRSFEIKLQGR